MELDEGEILEDDSITRVATSVDNDTLRSQKAAESRMEIMMGDKRWLEVRNRLGRLNYQYGFGDE